MFFVSVVLFILAGLFYAASRGEFNGQLRPLCQFGDVFCTHPEWMLYIAAICLVWALFLKVDRL